MFECPNCAKNLKFDIASQQLKCDACESSFDPYSVQKEQDAEDGEYFETNVFTCPQCGGQIISEDSEIATFCLFCGSSTILSGNIRQEKRPDYIIPFQKTKEDCKEIYQKMMKKAFFVPKEFKDEKFIDGFRGIYIPYWSYRFLLKDKVKLYGLKASRDGEYTRSDRYHIFADVDAEINGGYYDASASFYDEISNALAPFDLEKRQKFTPSFLSGFYANCAEVDEFIYYDDAAEYAQKEICQTLRKEDALHGYRMYDWDKVELNLESKPEKILYPVWFMSYRNKDRVAYATINGQTGKMVADFPVDVKKFLLTSVLCAIPLFVLLNLLFLFKQSEAIVLGLIFLFISLTMHASELHAIYERESLRMDKGVHQQTTSLNTLKRRFGILEYSLPGSTFLSMFAFHFEKGLKSVLIQAFLYLGFALLFYLMPFLSWPFIVFFVFLSICSVRGQLIRSKHKKNLSALILSVVSLFASVIILLLSPIQIFWYYCAVLLSAAAILLNFICVINGYNEFAMRKMPQFNKNGGNDYV